MSRLSISLFGSFQVRLGGEPVSGFEADKVRALLAYLAVEADRPQRRETLAGLLWPDFSERSARANLRNALANLRRAIGDHQASPPFLHITRQMIQFNRASDHWLDVATFTALLGMGETPSEQLAEAVALYQGAFLAGFSIPDSAAFEEWVLLRREAFGRQVMDALGRLANFYQERGAYDRALPHARRQVELEPWHEEAHQQLMRLLALSGRRSEALAQYETCRRALADELGVEPAAETTALYEQIRTGELSRGAEEQGSRGAEEQGSKGEKVSVVSLPPRTLASSYSHTSAHQHNLPAQTTPFVGREVELVELSSLLADPDRRLISILGPGGIGKTRLALEVAAAQLERFTHGVYFVPFAALATADNLMSALAEALNFTFYEASQPHEQLLNYLREKNLLLVMDNFEHLLDGVGLVADILQTAPKVKMIATSREALNLHEEQQFLVSGLDFPDAETVSDEDQYAAVQLFLQRAHRVQPQFEPGPDDLAAIAHICGLVEGMPLGLILAATWIKLLRPAKIAAEISQGLDFLTADLRNLPTRQRSLRAVFDQSWTLLTGAERTVFQKLSAFRGGFTREAAQVVTGASLPVLLALVDKSFLQRKPDGRFEIHELLRQYGAEKLDEVPDFGNVTRDKHSAYYAWAMNRWAEDLKGARQQTALAEIEADHENVQAAWVWAAEQGQIEVLAQAIDCLGRYYEWRGRYQEGESACRFAAEKLAAIVSGQGLQVLVKTLIWQSVFNRILGCTELAGQLLQQSLALLDSPTLADQDIRPERAYALLAIGQLKLVTSFKEARYLFEQSLALYRALDDPWGTAQALTLLGGVVHASGTYEEERPFHKESLTIRQALGDQRGVAESLERLGFGAIFRGQPEKGESLLRQGLATRQAIGDQVGMIRSLQLLGTALIILGQFAEAHALAEEMMRISEDLGNRQELAKSKVSLGIVELLLGQYKQARFQGERSFALFQEIDDHAGISYALWLLGRVALVEGAFVEAQRLLQESVAIHHQIGDRSRVRDVMVGLGHAERSLGNIPQVRQYLSDLLKAVIDDPSFLTMILTLPLAALLLVDQGQGEQAVELYALARRYPLVANSRWFEDVAGRHIAEIAATLPPEVVAAAQERGQARDLETTMVELLAELEESWAS